MKTNDVEAVLPKLPSLAVTSWKLPLLLVQRTVSPTWMLHRLRREAEADDRDVDGGGARRGGASQANSTSRGRRGSVGAWCSPVLDPRECEARDLAVQRCTGDAGRAPERPAERAAPAMLSPVHPAETSDHGLLEVALEAAGAGAAVLREQFKSSSLRVRSQGAATTSSPRPTTPPRRRSRRRSAGTSPTPPSSARRAGAAAAAATSWSGSSIRSTAPTTSCRGCRSSAPRSPAAAAASRSPASCTSRSPASSTARCAAAAPGADESGPRERLRVSDAPGPRRRLPRHRLPLPRPRRARPLPRRVPRRLPAGAGGAPLRRRGARPRPHRGRASTTASSSSGSRPGTSPPACC